MSRFVVDASVAVKLYVPEEHTDRAVQFFADGHELIAPDLMAAEFGNIIWKKTRLRGVLTEGEAEYIIRELSTLGFVYLPTEPLLERACRLALRYNRTVYDCLYLVAAEDSACQFITDDGRLANALQGSPLASRIVLIETYPLG